MAISGLDIYKLLPKTNCKECGFPTCLAFAMKLAAKQADLSACPYVSEESNPSFPPPRRPPIRLVTIAADGHKIEAGNPRPCYPGMRRPSTILQAFWYAFRIACRPSRWPRDRQGCGRL